MKRLVAFFCLLFLPTVTLAAPMSHDSCVENGKYKSEYKIDRRCYVTDEQKQQTPYNAVVKLTDKSCTGTIVKKDDGYFVYTARHCVYDGLDKLLNIEIELQDERAFSASFVKEGKSLSDFDDWAHYKIPVDKDDTSIPYVQTDSFEDGKVQIVGYGALKILSDKEIKKVKDTYVEVLTEFGSANDKENIKQAKQNGFMRDKMFVANWFGDYVGNRELKISDCELSNKILKGCQVWGGNSGGPLFNNQGGIMGIIATGNYQIGGSEHANVGLVVGVYSDDKTSGKRWNWVASSGEAQNYYTSIQQQNEQQERETHNTKVSNAQMLKQIQQENRMQQQEIRLQNQRMMMNMNKQYW